MTTTTHNADLGVATSRRERGTFSRLFQRMIEARQRQADRAVSAYLLSLDDRTLKEHGYDRAMLESKSTGSGSGL
jgi:hypothetical protein